MRIAFPGNFGPPHSTENHLARALEFNGHIVDRWQENDPRTWENLGEIPPKGIDMVLWVRTGWDWPSLGVTEEWAHSRMRRMQRFCRDKGVPVVSYHLDVWFGLPRAGQLDVEPFFESDLVVTADGGHAQGWAQKGINHVWFPPGVSLPETELGTYRPELASPIAFVGSWQGHYHPESEHRQQLVEWLQQNYRRDCAFWPKPGEPALRGEPLRDLYASVQVLVGDSCFVGTGLTRYASDRVPETIGRGGFLLHPRVEGVTDGKDWEYGPTFQEGQHLGCWEAFDWQGLGRIIEEALSDNFVIAEIASAGREHVRVHHTYERRVEQLIQCLRERDMLKAGV